MKNNRSKPTRVPPLTMAGVGLILLLWPAVGQCQMPRRGGGFDRVESVDPNATMQGNSWASFDIVLKRNIFSRNRRPARVEREDPRPAPPAPNPESYFVLRGVAQENDDFIAFIENTQTGLVQRLRRGDPVARGTIKTLTLDGLEYQMEDKTVVVRMGLDLEGRAGGMTTQQMLDLVTAPSTPGSPPSTPSSPPSGDEGDILKRLMEQRRQQLGQ